MVEIKHHLKNVSKVKKGFYLIIFLFYLISYCFFCRSILSLEGIETGIRVFLLISFLLYGLLYLLFGFKTLLSKKNWKFVLLSILTFLFASVFCVGAFYIDKLYSKLDTFTAKETSVYTTALVALKDTDINKDSILGMISDDTDRTGYILPLELIKKENMKQEIEYYSNYTELLNALYNHEVDAVFLTKDYTKIYSSEEKYQNISLDTVIIKEYSKEMKTEESELLATTKSLTEPFTVLVLGVDSESENGLDANAAFNGDTLMLITFNPKTLTATMFSVPRDLYVPIMNSYGREVGYNKINSSASYGTASTINTMEALTGIEIDYFVKVNFKGVIDLVDTLGGIDVDVEQPDYDYYVNYYGEGWLCESNAERSMRAEDLVCFHTGMQHLNGVQALAYARNRHGFLESDIARNRHQQQIIEALAKKVVKTSSFSDFEKLLDTISKNIATNMKTSQMLSFYQSLKGMLMQALQGEDFITIQKTQLTYFYFNNKWGLSCVGYYQGSLDAVKEAMEENLGLRETKTIKTFHYDYSEDYDQADGIIGKGIYNGNKVPGKDIIQPKEEEPEEEEEIKKELEDEEEEEEEENNNKTETEKEKEEEKKPQKPSTPDKPQTPSSQNEEEPNTPTTPKSDETETVDEPTIPGNPVIEEDTSSTSENSDDE